MKSRCTAGPGPRLLVINLVIFLLANCLVLVQSATPDKRGEVELTNWIALTENNWPKEDTQDKNPFLVYHSEYSTTPLFGLKSTFFDDIDLVSNPELSFRYWANKEASLRSRKDKSAPQREVKLTPSATSWQDSPALTDLKSSLKSITSEEWKHFGFVNQDVFTIALKDVNVKYVQKLHLDKLDISEVTAYSVKTMNDNFKESDDSPTIDGGVISFNLTTATFDLESLNAKSIKFDLVQNNKASVQVTIKPDKTVLPADLIPLFVITPQTGDKPLKEVTIKTVPETRGFTIAKIWYTENKADAKETALNPGDFLKSSFGKLFTIDDVEKSAGYVKLDDKQPTDANKDKDICYAIQKLNGPSAVIDVYLTLKDAPVGIKLDTVTEKDKDKEICLFKHIALQNIGEYVVTFVLGGSVAKSQPLKLNIKTQYKDDQKKVFEIPEGNVQSGIHWFYYNPQAFDYSIEIANADATAQFTICDIVSNCYPYESRDNKKFVLPEKVQAELLQSPFVRIQALFAQQPTFANKQAEQFNKKFLHDNEKSISNKPNTLSFQAKFDDKTKEATFVVPLDLIDLRAQLLAIDVKLNVDRTTDKKSQLTLVKWNYKKDSVSDEYSFPPELFKDVKITADHFHLATDQIFDFAPTQTVNGNSVSFVLKLESDAKPTVTVSFEIRKLQRNIKDKYLFSEDKDRKVIQVYPGDDKANPKDFKDGTTKKAIFLPANKNRLLITNWIRGGTDQKWGSTELKTTLTVASNGNDIAPANITVYRVMIGQGYPEFAQINAAGPAAKSATAPNKLEVKYVDDITKDESWKGVPTKGSFRIGYLVHSEESFDATIVVDQFDVYGNVSSDADNNCRKQATIAFSDCRYETLSCPFGGDLSEDTCTLKKFNRLVERKCVMSTGCSNIFDRQLPVSANYIPNHIDPADTNIVEYVPFQIEPQNTDIENYLVYKRPTAFPKGDFCVDFMYKAERSRLLVSEGVNATGIVFPITPKSNSDQDGKVCASWLNNDVDSVDELYFEFLSSPLYQLDNHNVEFEEEAKENKAESTIKEGIYINNLVDSQFTFPTKIKRVTESFERKDPLSNAIKLTIPLDKLKALPANAQVGGVELYVYTIRTKWIKLAKKDEHLKIGLTYDATSDKHKISSIKVKVNSPYERVWQGDISAFKANEIFSVSETTFDEHYQVEISVELNLAKIKEISNDLKESFVVTLNNFSINDPCVDKLNKLETCSGVDHGTCVRTYQESNFTGLCECNKAKSFHGVQCELQDYCAIDSKQSGANKICKTTCKNDDVNKQVECECPKGQVWSVFLKSCVDTKELTCPEPNEVLKYDPRTNKPTCSCMEGFVAFNKTCVPYDICNPVHRVLKNLVKTPCPNEHTSCVPNEKKTAFTCPCDSGYFLDLNSNCLPEDKCRACEHRCYQSGKEYKCSDVCKNGYVYNKEKKECEITDGELQKLADLLKCPGKKIELKDGKPSCVCGNQKFDPITRGCTDECSPEVSKTCTDKGAVKCTWKPDETKEAKGEAVCACKEGDIPYSANQSSSNAWTCMSRCDILELPEQHDAKCIEGFSHCDSKEEFTKYTSDLNGKEKGLESAGLIKGVFVFNKTELSSAATDKNYCKCETGFYKDKSVQNTGRCVPYDRTIHSIKGMEFDWNPYTEESQYLRDVEVAFEVLIKTVLDKAVQPKVDVGEFYGTKCVKKDDKTISCSTNFESDQDDAKIAALITKACVFGGTDGGKCFYLNLNTNSKTPHSRRRRNVLVNTPAAGSTPAVSILVQDKSKQGFHVEQKDYCKTENICAKYSYSICDNKAVKPFQCLLPKKPFFKVVNSELLTKNQLHMETGEVVNLCHDAQYVCKEADSVCNFHAERKADQAEYYGKSYCTCAGTNITLASHELSCKSSCGGQCVHSDACAQDYLSNKVTCHCSDGWAGEKCDKKVESESTSKAYLISTIVVSIIAAIALIGLAVLYFKRR